MIIVVIVTLIIFSAGCMSDTVLKTFLKALI